ncbi:hypothetical protein V6N12_003044 [Hibiscus sabdariffa]|uniref:Uncharacterized protein n=1 Tax=Hibiscus sabdariffa TaxID=183260 RepID=A0ABR2EB64_9ROSI
MKPFSNSKVFKDGWLPTSGQIQGASEVTYWNGPGQQLPALTISRFHPSLKRHTKFHSPLSHSSELVLRAFRQFLATFTFNPIHHLRALYAQSFRRTLAPPPSYRGCWHGVSRGFFLESCHDRALDERALRAGLALLHSRDIAGSGFRPLSKIPHCCPPWESGPCLSPSVADHPKRPAKHHWLGQPLPDQLPNTTQAHQTALFSFLQDLARTVRQIPTRCAPVRHFVLNSSHPLGETSYL